MISHLCDLHQNEASIGVAYIYFDLSRGGEQTHRELIGSVLKQLSQARPSIPENVKRFYDRHVNYRRLPFVKDLVEELDTVVGLFARVFIVLDALDECEEIARADFLSQLSILQTKHKINLLVTSRYPEVLTGFSQHQTLEIRAKNDDIFRYVQAQEHLFRKLVSSDPDLLERVKMEIVTASDGMYVRSPKSTITYLILIKVFTCGLLSQASRESKVVARDTNLLAWSTT